MKEDNKQRNIADPRAAGTLLFSLLTMCTWGVYSGICDGPINLVLGLIQLSCFIPYLIVAIIFYFKGNALYGSIYLVFAAIFGGISALLNIATGISEIYGVEINTQLLGIAFLYGAIMLIPVLVVIRKDASAVTFLCFSASMIFMLLAALVTLNVLPREVDIISEWLALFIAMSALYIAINSFLATEGCWTLPEGKPLFSKYDNEKRT